MEKKKVFSAVWYAAAGVSGAVMSIALFNVIRSSLLWVAGGAFVLLVLLYLYDIGVIAWAIKKIRPNTTSSWWEKYIETRQLYLAAAFLFFLFLMSIIMGLSAAPTRVDKEYFIRADDYHVLEAYLNGYTTENSFENEEWLQVYHYLEGKSFTGNELAVLTYYLMSCDDNFIGPKVIFKLKYGDQEWVKIKYGKDRKIQSCDFELENDSGHRIWILRAVWDEKISLGELQDWPNGSIYQIDVDDLRYDRKGRPVVTRALRKRLKVGPLTTKEILDIGYIPPVDTIEKPNQVLLYTSAPWQMNFYRGHAWVDEEEED